jgi:membrane-bound lytic murein transglycosylase F
VFVNAGTKYETRLRNLNAEIGGGIIIETVDDSLTTDDLIEMVSTGIIDFTVAENDVAMLSKTYFRNLDIRLPVSFNQRAAWAVRRSSPELAGRINEWFEQNISQTYYNTLYNKYFLQAKYFEARTVSIPKGAISPYDALFKKYAPQLGWDWQLLAAIAYEESRFDTAVVSWVGARGLMQMMPRTAAAYGLAEKDITNPDSSLKAATQFIKKLDQIFSKTENREERIKFILASYNAGHSHILDAQALATKYGKDRNVWQGNVKDYLILKSHSEYYNDSLVKSGYFRADQTVRYVDEVLRTYERFMSRKR